MPAMAYLRNLIYLLLLVLASPWLMYAAWWKGKYRGGWEEKLLGRVPRRNGDRRCLWLHAVSVGEINLLAPLLARWEKLFPDWDCVISTTTRAGYELARQKYAPRTVFYAPLDFSWAVERALRRIRPDLLVMAELEIWPNWIDAATRRGVPVAVVNGRLSEKSFRGYQKLQRVLQGTFSQLAFVAAQNEEYARRFRELGVPSRRVHVTGSVKFDGANHDRGNTATQRLAALAGIKPTDVVFLAGSTQETEETAAVAAWQSAAAAHPQLRLILVPRHPERFDAVAQQLQQQGVRFQRRSRLEKECVDPTARVLLVDVVGELGAWWGTAQIAFVGGSLTQRGGQNMIEPAAYGAAVSFGPNTWNFRDVVEQLLTHEAAEVVRDAGELTEFVRRNLEDPACAARLGTRARELVLAQTGAADRTIGLLTEMAGVAEPNVVPAPAALLNPRSAATRRSTLAG
jgi:3-deoxy-D-manno-octulosonic-acid transferase